MMLLKYSTVIKELYWTTNFHNFSDPSTHFAISGVYKSITFNGGKIVHRTVINNCTGE